VQVANWGVDMRSALRRMGVVAQASKPSSHHHPGFDFHPLSAPPEIESVGWISGKGV